MTAISLDLPFGRKTLQEVSIQNRDQVKVFQTVHHLVPTRKFLDTLVENIHLPTRGAASIVRVLDAEAIGFQPDFADSLNIDPEADVQGWHHQLPEFGHRSQLVATTPMLHIP